MYRKLLLAMFVASQLMTTIKATEEKLTSPCVMDKNSSRQEENEDWTKNCGKIMSEPPCSFICVPLACFVWFGALIWSQVREESLLADTWDRIKERAAGVKRPLSVFFNKRASADHIEVNSAFA